MNNGALGYPSKGSLSNPIAIGRSKSAPAGYLGEDASDPGAIFLWAGDKDVPVNYDQALFYVAPTFVYMQSENAESWMDATTTNANIVSPSLRLQQATGNIIRLYAAPGIDGTDTPSTLVELATVLDDLGVIASHTIQAPAEHLTGWFQDDVAASQTAVALNLANARTEIPMARAGSIIGVVVFTNDARTAGTLTVEPTINGTPIGLTAVLDGTNTTTKVTTQAVGLDTFTAGQRIGVKITTDGSWTPITADIDVTVLVA